MPTFLFHQQFTHIQGMMQSFRWFTTNQLKYQTQKNQIPSHSHIWTESIWVVKLVLSFSKNQFGKEFREPSNPSQCPKIYHWLKVEKSTSGVQLDFMHQENGPNNCDRRTFYLAMSFFFWLEVFSCQHKCKFSSLQAGKYFFATVPWKTGPLWVILSQAIFHNWAAWNRLFLLLVWYQTIK